MWAVIFCVIAAVLQTHAQPPRRSTDARWIRCGRSGVTRPRSSSPHGLPVANQAAPEIERVRALYADRGVRFWLVYVDPTEPADRIQAHGREYGLLAPAIRDPDHALVRRTGVHVTPEAAVYVFDGRHAAPHLSRPHR